MHLFVIELGAGELDVGGGVLKLALGGLHRELIALRLVFARDILLTETRHPIQ